MKKIPDNRLKGCPCGHLYDSDCIRHQPLPAGDPYCTGRCHQQGITELVREGREHGACLCVVSNPAALRVFLAVS